MLDSSKLKQKGYAYFQTDDLFYATEYSAVHFAKYTDETRY
jgi:tRNA G46 methylase TrmB